jgi:hypothetical protein
MASENGAVERYDNIANSVMASENGAVEQHNDITGANIIEGTAIGQYSPHLISKFARVKMSPRTIFQVELCIGHAWSLFCFFKIFIFVLQ